LEEVINVTKQFRRRFGTAGAFPILFREAWKEDIHVFAAAGAKISADAGTQLLGPPSRVTTNVLNLHPVAVLAVEGY
jgi:predicted deacetylase